LARRAPATEREAEDIVAIQGTIDVELEDAAVAVRRQAAFQGYAFAEDESTPKLLVFKKGASAFSWGSKMVVVLSVVSDSETRITITSKQSWALLDWGRGKRAGHKLLVGVDAKS
jgi:type IV secretory pathway TrbF-like protein